MGTVIQLESLAKQFGSVKAVDRVSLEVRRGEIYGFVGLNGAGKSTTIRMLLGMVRPDGGQARILGEMVGRENRDLWSRVGYMMERPPFYPELTATQNLQLISRLRGIPPDKATGAVAKVLNRVGLTPYRNRRAGSLSMGNAQRLGLAKALIHEPDLLILDEPTNGLDPAGIASLRTLLTNLAQQCATTIFLSSHLLGEVDRVVDRIGIIHQGRLLKEIDRAYLDGALRRSLHLKTRDRRRTLAALRAAGYNPVSRNGGGGAAADARDPNAGHANVGDANSGSANVGDANSGSANAGDANSGSANVGDANSGSANARDINAGSASARDSNARSADTASGKTVILVEPEAVARPETIAKLLADAGVPPTYLAVEKEDLEEYFFRLLRGGGGNTR